MDNVFPPDASRADMVSMAYKKRDDWSFIEDTDHLTDILCGSMDYYGNEEFEGLSYLEIEIKILNSVSQYDWHTAQPYGKPMWEHICCGMKQANPEKTDILFGLYDTAQALCVNLGTRGKILNLLGARSMSKTGGVVRLMNFLMAVKPDKTMIFISCPTDKISDTGAWGDFRAIANDMNKNHPDLFPDFYDYKGRSVQYMKTGEKFGTAMARTTAEAGNFVGIKGHDSGEGFIFVFCEEINKHPRSSYFDIMDNITSNRQLCVFNAWNWKTPDDMGAEVSVPDRDRSGMKGHEDIRIDEDQIYDGIEESIVIRFDGKYSVNILCGKRITPYTFFNLEDDWNPLLKKGENSPVFKSQARAYPDLNAHSNTVLTHGEVEKSLHNDTYSIIREIGRASHCDTSEGKGDSAEYSWAIVYEIAYTLGSNEVKRSTALVWQDFVRSIPIKSDQIWNDEWIEKAGDAKLAFKNVKMGSPVKPAEQIVIACARRNLENLVPNKNHGYDPSLNPDVVSAYDRLMGPDVAQAYRYNGPPKGFELKSMRGNTKELVYNRRDEIFFLSAEMFRTQQIRGGHYIKAPIEDLCRHRYQDRGKKRKVESNKEFKTRSKGRSPDKMVAMIGTISVAIDSAGLVIEGAQKKNRVDDEWEDHLRNDSKKLRKRKIKVLR